MKAFRTMTLLIVMVAMLGAIGCCPKPSPEPSSEPDASVMAAQVVTSKFIAIAPLNEDPDTCIVVPEELHMGNKGIKWVTFVNQTVHEVQIKFATSDTIDDVDPQTIEANEAGSFKLKNPNSPKTHEYSVSADCYEEPIARPRIIIP